MDGEVIDELVLKAFIEFLPQAGYAKDFRNQKHNTNLVPQQPGEQSKNVALNGDSKDAWTAVLDKSTGGVYWWNQQTGGTSVVLRHCLDFLVSSVSKPVACVRNMLVCLQFF